MSNNKIVYSNQGIKVLVDDQGQDNQVSKLKGVIDQTAYEYLEVSGNVEFLNDVNITGDISAANIELLPASTKRVLFNKVGKISSSADFVWDFDINKLSIVGEISASTFVKGDGSGLINLKSSELDYNTIALGGTTLALGQSTSTISGLTSITSTNFVGSLLGTAATASSNLVAHDYTTNDDFYLSYFREYTTPNDGQKPNISYLLKYNPYSRVLSAGSFSGNGSALTNLNASNITAGTIDLNRLPTNLNASKILIEHEYNVDADRYITFVDYYNTPSTAQTIKTDYLLKFNSDSNTLYAGYFSGNGSLLTNINASNLANGSISNLKLQNNKITIGSRDIVLGTSDSILAGLSSVTSTYFYGDLDGKINIANNISSHGEYFIPIVAGAGSQTIYRDTGLSFLTSTHTLKADYFDGDGSLLTNISTANIPTFVSDVRSQFSAGTDIEITNGVISFTGSVGTTTTAAGNAGEIQFNNGSGAFTASSNLYWDNTNGRLGINTNVPAAPLQFGNNAASGFSQHSYYQMILHYNATANYCYGLGIESGNMKFNSNGGYKFYVQGTEKISLSNTGNITATGFIGDGSQLTSIATSNLSGITSVSNGGTGFSSFSNGEFLVGNSSGTLSKHVFIAGNGIAISVGTSDTKISADFTKVATLDTSQTFTSQKTFSSSPVFNAAGIFNQGISVANTSTFSGDIQVQNTFYADQSLQRVGIKDSTPSYPLDVNGVTRINSYLIVGNTAAATTAIRPPSDNNLDLGNSQYRWDDIWATNTSINSTSDERRKELIEDIPYGVELLNSLRPVQYKWKDYTQTTEDGITIESKFTRKHFGIIAQELKTTLEEKNISTNDFGAYVYDSDSDSYAVRYGEFIPILIKSVQELSKENKELKTRLEILETLISSLVE